MTTSGFLPLPLPPSPPLSLPPPSIHRLVSARHLSKNKDYAILHAEKAKSGLTDLELPIRSGKEYLNSELHGRTRTKKEPLQTPEEGPSGEAPVITMSSLVDMLPGQYVEEQDDEVSQVFWPQSETLECREDRMFTEMEMSSTSGVDSQRGSTTSTPVCRSPFPDHSPVPESVSQKPQSQQCKCMACSPIISGTPPPPPMLCMHTVCVWFPNVATRMTYHKLKRVNLIMEYLERAHVVQGTLELTKV